MKDDCRTPVLPCQPFLFHPSSLCLLGKLSSVPVLGGRVFRPELTDCKSRLSC
jgi:hypothetical protein